MPRLTEEQKAALKKDIVEGKHTNRELMLKYHISEPALIKYKLPARHERANLELKETLVDTRTERKGQIQEIKETFAKLKAEIEKMDKARNADGTLSAGALKSILGTMLEVSRELDRQWTGIERADGLVADTIVDNRQVIINQDAIGKLLWAFLEERGLLNEALKYIRGLDK